MTESGLERILSHGVTRTHHRSPRGALASELRSAAGASAEPAAKGNSSARSHVPDLLFEDVCERRLQELGDLLTEPARLSSSTPLHRITLFATYACNLACPYCKTIARSSEELLARPEKRITWTLDGFGQMLSAHGETPIRHLHFTGGEATLLPELPEMVREAKRAGVECVSITTNGATRVNALSELVTAGIDEIRVSLDANDRALSSRLTVHERAFERTTEALRALGRLKVNGARFFLVINTVVGRANRERLADIVEFCLQFHPDDMKLITEVDERGTLGEYPQAREQVARIRSLLDAYPTERFPLLRRKLDSVFAGDAVGLEQLERGAPLRCYIPLTERTIDGKYYYPCSVYLREGGKPIGSVDEPEALKRQKTIAFVEQEDCSRDPICARYCLACTRGYNVLANQRQRAALSDRR